MSLIRAASMPAAMLALAQGAWAQGAQSAATIFTVRVENISSGEVLRLSNGKTAPFVAAPVLWAVHTGSSNPIFTGGQPDAGKGLEVLAETGNPSARATSLASEPGVVAVGAFDKPVGGRPADQTGDRMAADQRDEAMAADQRDEAMAADRMGDRMGAQPGGPIAPGQAYEFEITARPGQYLSVAWMFGQSNDLFYSNDRPVALFTAAGMPVSGDMTPQVSLWDAGTEANEEPGLGANQAPRQASEDAGTSERQAVAHVRDQWTYPRTGDVLRFTITPSGSAVSSN